jgi:hypothetical protein
MSTITEVIPSLGSVPTTADPASFDSRADELLGDKLPAFRDSANIWATQANVVAGEVNSRAGDAEAAAVAAALSETAAASAVSVANYKGAWVSLTGALNIPASVSHNGQIWLLESNLANVTTSEPGVGVEWAALDVSAIEGRSTNTVLGVLDRGKVIRYSAGGITQTFSAAAALGPNWYVTLVNNATSNITLDPFGAETIEVETLKPGDVFTIFSNGSALLVIPVIRPGMTLLSVVSASAVATVDFTGLTSDYDEYEIHLQNVVPVTDAVTLHVLTSANNGSSWDTGAGNYRYYGTDRTTIDGDGGDTKIPLGLANSIGSDTNETGVCGVLRVFRPAAAEYTNMNFMGGYISSAGVARPVQMFGYRLSAAAVNGIQFLFSSGNVETGFFKLYGVRKV